MNTLDIFYKTDRLDVPDDQVIPITKQVNDIGDLNVFKSDFSQEFRVKRTRQMERLLENVAYLGSETELPYKQLDVRVFSQGMQIMPGARMSVNRVDDDFIYCNLFSGAKNLFDRLREKNINDLDLSDMNHDWTAENARDSILNNEDYQYLFTDFSDDGQIIDGGDDPLRGYERIFRPYVKVKELIDRILADVNLVSDIDDDDLYKELFVLIQTLKPPKEAVSGFLVERFHDGGSRLATPRLHLGKTVIFDPNSVSNAVEYTARFDGTFQFAFTFYATTITSVYVIKNEGQASQETLTPDNTIVTSAGQVTFTLEVELNTGDTARFFFDGPGTILGAYHFRCTNIDADSIGRGSPVVLAGHLPAIRQAEFVKAICKYFGLIPTFDALTNTLTLWSANRLNENKRIARDWSKFMDYAQENISYRLAYSRVNNFKWIDDDDVSEGAGNTAIMVNDENLDPERDLLNMPFAYSDEVTHGAERMARIGWFESVAGTDDYKENESIAPRLVLRQTMATATRYTDSDTSTDYDLTIAQSRKARTGPIDLFIALSYNATIVRMLNKTKVLNKTFNLPATEIARLDHSIPVYLDQYNDYFFVKKVNNWTEGELCTVELIRL